MIKHDFHKDQEKDLSLGLIDTGGDGQKHTDMLSDMGIRQELMRGIMESLNFFCGY